MRRTGRLPHDQAELVFGDHFTEALAELSPADRAEVLTQVVSLCTAPGGKHPLKDVLGGWNTLDVLAGRHRVVFRATQVDGVGLVEVLCLGPRSDSEVYDVAAALVRTGELSQAEVAALWEALAVLEVVAEDVGLDGWDYAPPPAPAGQIRAVVAAGLLEASIASLLSQDELLAAMTHGWGPSGPDSAAALRAALHRARLRAGYPGVEVVLARAHERCGALLPRARARCIRRNGHPGAHRSSP
jgi:hypothetical protein